MKLEGLFYDVESPVDCPPLTDEMLAAAESRLGYCLPAAFITVLRYRNGGYLQRSNVRSNWMGGFAAAAGTGVFLGLGGVAGIDVPYLNAPTLNQYLIEQWGYPATSIAFGHMGHSGFALDYRDCRSQDEPTVIYCDAEMGYPIITIVSKTFGDFFEMLYE